MDPKRHNKTNWECSTAATCQDWRPIEDGVALFQPQTVTVSRYRYRAANIPSPWPTRHQDSRVAQRHGLVESRMRGDAHVRFGGRDEGTIMPAKASTRLIPTQTRRC